ncbi:MAG: hypothetical protein EBU90_01690 [Proteobacteria bacterium]|nr:hypothetical protein [Pseudomonadota bacterium]
MENFENIEIFAPYIQNCKATWKETNKNQEIYHAYVGIVSEFPELRDSIHKKDYINRLEETGDILYYSSILTDLLGITESIDTLILSWSKLLGNDANQYFQIILNGKYSSPDMLFVISDSIYELSDLIKKHIEYSKPLDKQYVVEILVRIYAALFYLELKQNEFDAQDSSNNIRSFLIRCMNMNYLKLWLRYGKKFSETAAINRDTKVEYNALKMSVGFDTVYNSEEMETFYITRQPDVQHKSISFFSTEGVFINPTNKKGA